MIGAKLLCLTTLLFQSIDAKSFPRQDDDPDYEYSYPALKSDFKKGNISAKWAPGFPRRWGTEDERFMFNEPEPEDAFGAVVTEDEKYIAMLNGSHVRFVDLDTKATVTTIDMGAPRSLFLLDLVLRSTPQGGYDVLANGELGPSRYPRGPKDIFHIRLGPDLKPTQELITYPGGSIGDIDKKGRTATTRGYIYDLNNSNGSRITLQDPPTTITGMSFSTDGRYLSTVGSSANLWNATSGEKIYTFPSERSETWLTKFAPDGKYVAVASQLSYTQIHSLSNISAAPKLLGPFQGLIFSIAWSPDSTHLAICDVGRMQIWKFPEMELVQLWDMDSYFTTADNLANAIWLDGGKKLSFFHETSRFVYDFETNTRYWITQGNLDRSWDWQNGRIQFLKKRGYLVTEDGDSSARFWKV